MTPLEQKAISAVGCKRENPQCLNCVDFDCKRELEGFKKGYTEALRWRDVNVERVPRGIKVILKQEDRYVGFGFFYDGSFTHSCTICDKGRIFRVPKFTHWRPIETI